MDHLIFWIEFFELPNEIILLRQESESDIWLQPIEGRSCIKYTRAKNGVLSVLYLGLHDLQLRANHASATHDLFIKDLLKKNLPPGIAYER